MRSNAYCGNLLWQSGLTLRPSETKVAAFFEKHPTLRNYKVSCRGLSLADM